MTMLIKKILPVLLIWLVSVGYSQNISITNITNDRGKLIVNYTLAPNLAGEKYNLQLYSSHNNYASPVTFVEGDIGSDIQATGTTMTVIWDAAKELKNYTGQLQVEIKGSVSYIPIHSNMVIPTTKAGKSVALRWNGGGNSDQIKLDLYNGGVFFRTIGTLSNNRSYEWLIPEDVTKGKSYQIKFTNTSQTSESFLTTPFGIKQKTKATWILIPVGVVGAGVGVYYGFIRDPDEEQDLPNPPDAPQ